MLGPKCLSYGSLVLRFAILFGKWVSYITEGNIISGSTIQQVIIGNKRVHFLAPIIPQLFACNMERNERQITKYSVEWPNQ